MASLGKGVLVSKAWQPLLQTVRYRRVNVQRPRPPHYERALFEALAQPIFPKPIDQLLPQSAKCKKVEEEAMRNYKIDNPYEDLLAKDCFRLFNESSLVAICHMNPIKAESKFNMFIRFRRDNMVIKEYGRRIIELSVKGTRYEPVVSLYKVRQCTIFCPEPKVNELLKSINKTPELILLAGIVDGYFANVNQMQEYATLNGDISQARAQLVSVLNSAAHNVVTSLNQHQTILTSSLDQYADMIQKNSVTEDSIGSGTSTDSTSGNSETPS